MLGLQLYSSRPYNPHSPSHEAALWGGSPQGSARDRDRREKERQQLADLVGKNLTYVSQVSLLGMVHDDGI